MGAKSLVSGLVVIGLLAGGGYALARFLDGRPVFPLASDCQVTGSFTVELEADQMANAATIAAVGLRRDLPARAVTVALATALQESKLRNLPGGDRDSIGLFQQRPSQGWGDPAELSDPRYAAGAFYDHLVRIPGWQDMRVTDAAQAVQRSAHPEAYQKWAEEAEVLSAALSGGTPGAVSCWLPAGSGGTAHTIAALGDAIALDWGKRTGAVVAGTADGITLAVPDGRSGWRLAHWLVSHAAQHGITDVRYAGKRWTARGGEWHSTGNATGAEVVALLGVREADPG